MELDDIISRDGKQRIGDLINDVEELKARANIKNASSGSLEFYYESQTVAPPSTASFRFNNTNPAAAGALYFSFNARNGLFVSPALQLFGSGDIAILTEQGNSDNAMLCSISAVVIPGVYLQYTLTSVAIVGTHTAGKLYNLELFTA